MVEVSLYLILFFILHALFKMLFLTTVGSQAGCWDLFCSVLYLIIYGAGAESQTVLDFVVQFEAF